MSKFKVIKDYEKLFFEVIEQIKLVYFCGFICYLVSFINKDGEWKMGLLFEMEEYYYFICMMFVKVENIIEEDDDYDDDGNFKVKVKVCYEDKYDDFDFLDDFNFNDDNDLGGDDDLEGLEDILDEVSEEEDDFDD